METVEKMRNLLKRMAKCDSDNWMFIDNKNTSGYFYIPRLNDDVSLFGVSRTTKDLKTRYKLLLRDVLDNPIYFKKFPKCESWEELEMTLDLMGY